MTTSARPPGFPAFAVTADLVVLTVADGLRAVVVRRAEEPFAGRWALPGGFLRADEALETAARRVLAEETGLDEPGHLEQLATYGDPDRDPRMRVVSVAHLALVPDALVPDAPVPDAPVPAAGARTAAAGLRAVPELLAPGELAFDHTEVLADGVERLRSKLEYTTLATRFLPAEFTLAQLRGVYLAVWGRAPDLSGFRRKVLETDGFVQPTGATSTPGALGGRPAATYRAGPAGLLHPPFLRPGTPA